MKFKNIEVFLKIVMGFLMLPSLAFAHAHLHESEPAKDALVSAAPVKVILHFTEALELPLCKVTVTEEGKGMAVSSKELTPQHGDQKSIEVSLNSSAMKSAVYQVNWKVVSKDGHRMQGDYRFTVNSLIKKK